MNNLRQLIYSALPIVGLTLASLAHAQTYRLTDLGVLPNGYISQGVSINNAGQAVGTSFWSGGFGAFLYSNGTLTNIGQFTPTGINNSGQVSGYTFSAIAHMIMYQNGQITDLGVPSGPPGNGSYGLAINDAGEIVGGSDPWRLYSTGLTYANGTFARFAGGWGVSVNNSGQIAGQFDVQTPGTTLGTLGMPVPQGWVYRNGVLELLNSLDGTGQSAQFNPSVKIPVSTLPSQINNSGVITGVAMDSAGSHAFILKPIAGSFSGIPSDISPAGTKSAAGVAINSQGQVTGYFYPPAPSPRHAFIFSKATSEASKCLTAGAASAAGDNYSIDLNTLVNSADPLAQYVTLIQGDGINDSGVILADGIDSRTQQTHAYLVSPIVGPAPLITTFAGGAAWHSTSPLSMTTETFRVALGPDGAIYGLDAAVLSTSGSYVYRIDPSSQTITRVVGTGVAGYTGDGCPATSATFNRPEALAFDARANLFIADTGNNVIRMVTPDPAFQTSAPQALAGGPLAANSVVTSLAINYIGSDGKTHSIAAPVALKVDASRRYLYVAGQDSAAVGLVGVVLKIDTTAIQAPASLGNAGTSTVNGIPIVGNCTFSTCITAVGSPALSTNIQVNALALDAYNNLYLAPANYAGSPGLVQIDAATQTLHAVAAFVSGNQIGCSKTSPITSSNMVIGDMAFESTGNLIIADAYSNLVCRATVDTATGIVDAGSMISPLNGIGSTPTLAPFGQPSAFDGGPVSKASFVGALSGVAIDASGDIFLADNTRVHEIVANPSNVVTPNSIIRTAAGGYDGQVFSGDGNVATSATLGSINAVATDMNGNVYIAGSNLIRRVDASTKLINTYAGDSYGPDNLFPPSCGHVIPYSNGDGGLATCVTVYPVALTIDASGGIVFADTENQIRRIQNHILSTWVPAPSGLSTPKGLAVDASGNLFIADTNNNQVKMATPSGAISILAGTGQKATVICTVSCPGDGGPAQSASLYGPTAVALDHSGHLYFTDNNSVRMVNLATKTITTAYSFPPDDIYGGKYGVLCTSPSSGFCVHEPMGLARDAAGNLFVADAGNANNIVKLTPNADNSRYFARAVTWSGTAQYVQTTGSFFYFWYGGDGGAPINARVNDPLSLSVDRFGNLYVADNGDFRVRLITGVAAAVADLNGDGQVDSKDMALITAALNKPSTGPNDPRDLNHDGVINMLDARILATLCTHPGCAIQ